MKNINIEELTIKQMKKWYWCLFRATIFYRSKSLDKLIIRCMELINNCPNVKVDIDYYHITIKTESSTVILWNANKFHGWLGCGSVNGVSYLNKSPSASVMYDFKELLISKGYDINPPKPTIDINITDIKC